MSEKKCGNCRFAEKHGDSQFCTLKDLYTFVDADRDCDEKNIHGELIFCAKSKEVAKK